MGTRLLIAAGGGGDAIAAVMIARSAAASEPIHVATYSWDRLIVDPLPGPRDPSDFSGLEPVGQFNHRVTATTLPRAPAGSTLPGLAVQLPATFYLLDPSGGAIGLSQQLKELASMLSADTIDLVDVGGDIVASGDEPSLRSPLADSLTLAAAYGSLDSASVLVAGPGLDGELPEHEVLSRCKQLANHPPVLLSSLDMAEIRQVLEWHPSEATGLFWTATLGLRGQVEVRDHAAPVAITDRSPEVWRLEASRVFAVNRIAQAIASTQSMREAELAVLTMAGTSEIDYERRKAASLTSDGLTLSASLDQLPAIEAHTTTRGMHFMTMRRVAQALNLRRPDRPHLVQALRRRNPGRCLPPLWAIDAEGERLLEPLLS
jgi:hypothetical protein